MWYASDGSDEAHDFTGCFYCRKTFVASEIEDWIDNDQTAMCPRCSIDSVLADSIEPRALDQTFLSAMHARYFGVPQGAHVPNGASLPRSQGRNSICQQLLTTHTHRLTHL